MKVVIFGYRDWAAELAKDVQFFASSEKHLIIDYRTTPPEYALTDYDAAFFVGWSQMVPEYIYTQTPCFVLHPSPLPRYRGGSPIQHQILQGETQSAVTIFQLSADYPEVDSGPIVWQMGFSLDGELSDIFSRIVHLGSQGIQSIIRAWDYPGITPVPQPVGNWGSWKRRTPDESELTLEDQARGAVYMANKVRALQEPYPLPYLTCGDGRRLYIFQARAETEVAYAKRQGDAETDAILSSLIETPRCPVCGEPGIGKPLGCGRHGLFAQDADTEAGRCTFRDADGRRCIFGHSHVPNVEHEFKKEESDV